jgi:hypothetical protein
MTSYLSSFVVITKHLSWVLYEEKTLIYLTVLEARSPRSGSSMCLASGEGLLTASQHDREVGRRAATCRRRQACGIPSVHKESLAWELMDSFEWQWSNNSTHLLWILNPLNTVILEPSLHEPLWDKPQHKQSTIEQSCKRETVGDFHFIWSHMFRVYIHHLS